MRGRANVRWLRMFRAIAAADASLSRGGRAVTEGVD